MKSSDLRLHPPTESASQKQIQDQSNQSGLYLNLAKHAVESPSLQRNASHGQSLPLTKQAARRPTYVHAEPVWLMRSQPSSESRHLASVARSRMAWGLCVHRTNQLRHLVATRAPGHFCQLRLNNANYVSSFFYGSCVSVMCACDIRVWSSRIFSVLLACDLNYWAYSFSTGRSHHWLQLLAKFIPQS